MEERPPIWRVAVNKLNKQPRTTDEVSPPARGLGEVLTSPLRKKYMLRITHVEMLSLETKLLPHSDLRWGVFLEEISRSRKRNRNIWLGTWNVEVGGGRGDWMELTQDRERLWALVGT
jgi:hypothetical protein